MYPKGGHRLLRNVAAAQDAGLKLIQITSRKLEASLDDTIIMSRLAETYARLLVALTAPSTKLAVMTSFSK
jgi:hypothetical protein